MSGRHNAVVKIEIKDVQEWSDFHKGNKFIENELKTDLRDRLRDLGVPYNDIEIEVKVEKE
jgi:hypothetical protein